VSTVRFYVRNADGSIEDDETYPVVTADVDRMEKDFTVFGQRKTMVIEFDPPWLVPPLVEQGDEQ
jgi:hypothetical protein